MSQKIHYPSSRQPFSAVIITKNAATQLAACLESAAFADEILVVDSGSSDETVALAQRYSARVIQKEWLGFGAQKQFAVDRASHDWVLCLDADERVSDALRQSLLQELAAPRAHAYEMARCNRFMGRWLHHGEGYPDWSLRLFDRRHARWSDDPVHEKVIPRGAVPRLLNDTTVLNELLATNTTLRELLIDFKANPGKYIRLRL